jgi:hypothetical protein
MRIKFNGEFGSQEIVEHVAKYLSKFFDKYPIKSVKGINVYFNMYNDEGTMVAPGRDGEIIQIIEITDPHKVKKLKGNVVQMPVVEIIEITEQDLERKEKAKAEKRLEKMFQEYQRKNKSTQKSQLKKEGFEEKRRQNMLMKKQPKKSE